MRYIIQRYIPTDQPYVNDMNKRDEIKKIWRECFNDSQSYVDMYFSRVYRDEDAMTLAKEGQIVSSLLLQQYPLLFHDKELSMGYIAGAATRRNHRGRGYMAELMHNAIKCSVERGDMMCSLIPAHDWLYFYYVKFGFSTVFYVDPQRFTSLHSFPTEGEYFPVDDFYSSDVYDAFHSMETQRKCSVIHSKRDFLNILDDLKIDGGQFVVMADQSRRIVSMLWASEIDDVVVVRELMGYDSNARKAALRQLRKLNPEKPMKVLAPPLDEHRKLYDRGMARIVNVKLCLDAIAQGHPDYKAKIRVYDNMLDDNNHIYIIENGECGIDDSCKQKLDLDVTLDVFNRIVFSSESIGKIIGFPSVRPQMSLMLD